MRKVSKSIIGTGLAVALSMTMCMSVFAAKSPQKDGVVTEITGAKDQNNNSVDIEITNIPEEYKKAAEEMENPASMKATVQNIIEGIKNGSIEVKEEVKEALKELEGIKEENLALIDVREVTVKGDASLVKFPIDITFEVPGVLETSKVAVLHYVDGAWQLEPSKAGKGTITATFESLSPVAFVVDKSTVASSTTAPQTGVAQTLPIVVAIIGIGAACVLIVKGKKSTI